jgi:hypothetical protein
MSLVVLVFLLEHYLTLKLFKRGVLIVTLVVIEDMAMIIHGTTALEILEQGIC